MVGRIGRCMYMCELSRSRKNKESIEYKSKNSIAKNNIFYNYLSSIIYPTIKLSTNDSLSDEQNLSIKLDDIIT
jgi:hypothetical protein